ncbi:hypothetical protein IQ06DRAFT_112118 [Phaeosphaeriaceae sp. SRC1lsM3a]|nr:hypothetical protein IQ06DRAFT_112118 [Stagonospora sp. SRC1lsM3a]
MNSALRPTAAPFYPRTNAQTHTAPPNPYISTIEPYYPHPVTYVQTGPHQHIPLYIYHQVRGIFVNERFHAQQEQYFYSHIPPPSAQPEPVASLGYEWWPGDEGEGAWVEYGGGGYGVNGYGYGYGYGYVGEDNRRYKFGKMGKKGKGKKGWWYKGKKKGEDKGRRDRWRLTGGVSVDAVE